MTRAARKGGPVPRDCLGDMEIRYVRHFVAVKDGKVVGSRSVESDLRYPWAVLHCGARGYFATFHQEFARAAVSARRFFGGRGVVVRTLETRHRVEVGARFDQEEVVH